MRDAKDYAIEHAEYLAQGAEHFIDASNALAYARETGDNVESCEEAEHEARCSLCVLIYEFRKRRERAVAGVTSSEVKRQEQ